MESIEGHGKKRSKKYESSHDSQISSNETLLLPGLPNHLAQLCLTKIPPHLLYSVSRSWQRLLFSPSFPPVFSLYALISPPLHNNNFITQRHYDHTMINNSIEFTSLDPISSTWQPLPSPPPPHLHFLHRHPSFISRNLPIQSLTVSNHLVLIAGTTHSLVPALPRPLVFHPESNRWLLGPPFTIPRRWCATGSIAGKVFVASGLGSNYRGDVARSMEKWDMNDKRENWKWETMAAMKDGRFSREAVEAVGFKGKLCMVNVKGKAPKEGLVYDVETDKWKGMPPGMLAGWTGPAAGTVEGDVMYVVEEAKGALCEYDCVNDCWVKVIELPELRHAEQVAAGRGRVCVVCANGERVVVVDVVAKPARVVRAVEPPRHGQRVAAVHVLPRMSRMQE